MNFSLAMESIEYMETQIREWLFLHGSVRKRDEPEETRLAPTAYAAFAAGAVSAALCTNPKGEIRRLTKNSESPRITHDAPFTTEAPQDFSCELSVIPCSQEFLKTLFSEIVKRKHQICLWYLNAIWGTKKRRKKNCALILVIVDLDYKIFILLT